MPNVSSLSDQTSCGDAQAAAAAAAVALGSEDDDDPSRSRTTLVSHLYHQCYVTTRIDNVWISSVGSSLIDTTSFVSKLKYT